MTKTEYNEKMARFSEVMLEAYKIMEEFSKLAKKYKFVEDELLVNENFGLPVSSINLPKNIDMRFMHVCGRYKIETIGDLMNVRQEEFLRYRNIGHKVVVAVASALKKQFGIDWR